MGSQTSKAHDQNVIVSKDIGDGVRISTKCPGDEVWQFADDDPKTAFEVFQRGQRLSSNGSYLGTRESPGGPYEWLSYAEVSEMSDAFGSGLLNECNVAPNNDTKIGIFSSNRVEWIVTDQACARFSLVIVPLYSTLGLEACQHIISQTDLKVIVCDNQQKLETLCSLAPELSQSLHLVVMDLVTDEAKAKVADANFHLHAFDDIMKSGRETPHDLVPAKPDDMYTICYTSGTTGVPKGVVLTHKAMTINVCSLANWASEEGLTFNSTDTNFSYLPLAHAYEKLNILLTTMSGSRSGFFSGDMSKFLDDMQALQPTILTAVPRILYKFYDKIYAEAKQSFIKQMLLDRGVASKMADLHRGVQENDTIWDRFVFPKIRDLFGGRIRLLITGSAPLDPTVMNFFRVALSCAVFSGYGQTEVCCASISAPFDYLGNHVGAPLPCNYIKLIDVPELGYRVSEGFGEVCIKGENAFSGYFKMPEKSAETKDQDGWVHTGDVGKWTEQGNLQIVDRCKQIFKLSQGEYIAPEKLEGVFLRCILVSQVFVDGLSDKDHVVAVVVPDFETVRATLDVPNDTTTEALCENSEVKQKILEEMDSVGRAAGLKGFEIVKNIFLTAQAFSQENGMLTVTMKAKRTELRKRFAEEIRALYEAER